MAEQDQFGRIEDWGREINPKDFDGYPMVFHFQPQRFVKVEPDRLKDWEELTRRHVGLSRPGDGLRGWSGDPCETISGSGDGWDDSDCW